MSEQAWRVLCATLVITFLIGGGARPDLASLILLRPLAILVVAYGLVTATRAQLAAHRALIGMLAALVILHLAQLIPLPPAIWQSLPGRDLVAEIDRLAGIGPVWRPMSMTPDATWNSLWSLAVPGAVLMLAIQLGPAQHRRLVPWLVAIGVASALIAVLQSSGDPKGPFYFYRVTNEGDPVGLFASRTHQAIYLACTLAMVIAWWRMAPPSNRVADLLTVVAAAILVLMIVATGSRAGVLLGLLAAFTAWFALGRGLPVGTGGGKSRPRWWAATAVTGLAGLLVLAIVLGRAIAIERILATDLSDDLRVRAMPTVLAMVGHYAPWGSGLGSFAAVFHIHQPRALLAPAYFNHAHNDWLEPVVTAGLPAALLLVLAAAWLGLQTCRAIRMADRQDRLLPRLGALIIGILALASLSDYPLRVPSLMALAVVAAVWLHRAEPNQQRIPRDADDPV